MEEVLDSDQPSCVALPSSIHSRPRKRKSLRSLLNGGFLKGKSKESIRTELDNCQVCG